MRVGVLGPSHDHGWSNLAALATGAVGQLVVAADPDPRFRERLAAAHGGVTALVECDALLERRDLDAVLVFADNRTSADLGVRALRRGLPVMVEKPMAADLEGAEALLGAARSAPLPLMVNWPIVWRPDLGHGLALARAGVGEPVQVSHRGGHAGPREYGCSPQFCSGARAAGAGAASWPSTPVGRGCASCWTGWGSAIPRPPPASPDRGGAQ